MAAQAVVTLLIVGLFVLNNGVFLVNHVHPTHVQKSILLHFSEG